MVRVLHADVELFLTGWLRNELATREEPYAAGVVVSNKEPASHPDAPPFPARLVVIRDDGSTRTEVVTDEVSVGVSVLAGSKEDGRDASNLARLVRALIEDCPSADPANPIAAVLQSNGPYPVDEDQPRSRYYLTFVMSRVGRAL